MHQTSLIDHEQTIRELKDQLAEARQHAGELADMYADMVSTNQDLREKIDGLESELSNLHKLQTLANRLGIADMHPTEIERLVTASEMIRGYIVER